MVDGAGIVHMRGRIYDPRLGRFLQADPIVQDPLNAQSYNRYTYVFNNPLSLIDPSGYRSLSANLELYWKPITAIAIVVATSGQAGLALKAGAAGEALAWAVVGGAGAGLVTTGTLRGTVMGAADGLLTFGIGEGSKESTKALLLAQSLKGGLLEGLNGGDFGHGFVTAGLSKATGLGIAGLDLGPASSIILNAMAGGTVSAATGGKFANGAVSAAVQFAFNQALAGLSAAAAKAIGDVREKYTRTPSAEWSNSVDEPAGPHEYVLEERVCEYSASACTQQNFKENYGRWFSAPSQTNIAKNGAVNYLPAFGRGGAPKSWPVVHELEYYNTEGMDRPFMRTANVTLLGHVLFGRVDRYYVSKSDGIYSTTLGIGRLSRTDLLSANPQQGNSAGFLSTYSGLGFDCSACRSSRATIKKTP